MQYYGYSIITSQTPDQWMEEYQSYHAHDDENHQRYYLEVYRKLKELSADRIIDGITVPKGYDMIRLIANDDVPDMESLLIAYHQSPKWLVREQNDSKLNYFINEPLPDDSGWHYVSKMMPALLVFDEDCHEPIRISVDYLKAHLNDADMWDRDESETYEDFGGVFHFFNDTNSNDEERGR